MALVGDVGSYLNTKYRSINAKYASDAGELSMPMCVVTIRSWPGMCQFDVRQLLELVRLVRGTDGAGRVSGTQLRDHVIHVSW